MIYEREFYSSCKYLLDYSDPPSLFSSFFPGVSPKSIEKFLIGGVIAIISSDSSQNRAKINTTITTNDVTNAMSPIQNDAFLNDNPNFLYGIGNNNIYPTSTIQDGTDFVNGLLVKEVKSKQIGVNQRRKSKKNNINRAGGQWKTEDDSILMNLASKQGKQNWAVIAKNIKAKSRKQCRERWYNHLRPSTKGLYNVLNGHEHASESSNETVNAAFLLHQP